ncbi:MAG: LamG domain-containing protein [Candidatus Aenigmatarchaeota archaeon]
MKGVSPIVSTLLIFLLVIFSITITLTAIKPSIDRITDSSNIQEGINNLNLLSSIINDVSSEAIGSKRTFFISISDGEIIFDRETQTISYEYKRKSDMELKGSVGNIFLDSGNVIFEDFFNTNKSWICKGICNIENNAFKVKGSAFFNLNKNLTSPTLLGYVSKEGIGTFITNPESLVLWLKFDEGNGTIVYDYSGNLNNGTYYGYNPHTQYNSAILQLTGSSPINLTHSFYLPSKAILSDINLTVNYINNTADLTYNTIRVFVNGNYIGSFNDDGETSQASYTFYNILKGNFTAGALNSITYEGNVTNITKSTLSYLQEIGWVDGKYGEALSFDGIDDYVEVADSESLKGMNELTIMAWIYGKSFKQYSGIVEKWAYNSQQHYLFGYFTEGSSTKLGKFTLFVSQQLTVGASDSIVSYTNLDLNRWYHIAGVFKGGQFLKTYVNGVLDNSKSTTIAYIASGTKPVRIGRYFAYYFDGLIDEVRIYNRALSEEEIKILYEEGLKLIKEKYGEESFKNKIQNASIFLSSPKDFSTFDNIRVLTKSKSIKLTLPLEKAEIVKTTRIGKGNYEIEIKKIGFNTTTRKSILEVNLK